MDEGLRCGFGGAAANFADQGFSCRSGSRFGLRQERRLRLREEPRPRSLPVYVPSSGQALIVALVGLPEYDREDSMFEGKGWRCGDASDV